jgi:hypothetical protein
MRIQGPSICNPDKRFLFGSTASNYSDDYYHRSTVSPLGADTISTVPVDLYTCESPRADSRVIPFPEIKGV